jgi:hypothetical protein
VVKRAQVVIQFALKAQVGIIIELALCDFYSHEGALFVCGWGLYLVVTIK